MKNDAKNIVNIQYYHSPCGILVLGSVGGELCLCDWQEKPCAERNKRRLERMMNAEFAEEPTEVLTETQRQLDEYFAGVRTAFTIPIHPVGTDFQQRVWKTLLEIPYGETLTYKAVAAKANNAKGIRAVAQAIGANGMSIIIPCHRVIGSDNTLTGFAGGLEAKRILIELEKQNETDFFSKQAVDTSIL